MLATQTPPPAAAAAKRRQRPGGSDSIARSGKLPLYVQCASLLRSRINGGEWPIGKCLPSFNALAARFQVAIVTVRQAVAMLETEGLLERRQGAGTFVIGQTIPADWIRLGATWNALMASLQTVEVQVVNRRVSHLQPRLEIGEGQAAAKYRFLSRLHMRNKRPFCKIDLYLEESINQLAPRRFDRQLVLPLMTELSGDRIARAWQILSVGKADPPVAEQLRIDVGDPVAFVRRVVVDHQNTVIYLAEIVYRGDVVRIEMNLLGADTPQLRPDVPSS